MQAVTRLYLVQIARIANTMGWFDSWPLLWQLAAQQQILTELKCNPEIFLSIHQYDLSDLHCSVWGLFATVSFVCISARWLYSSPAVSWIYTPVSVGKYFYCYCCCHFQQMTTVAVTSNRLRKRTGKLTWRRWSLLLSDKLSSCCSSFHFDSCSVFSSRLENSDCIPPHNEAVVWLCKSKAWSGMCLLKSCEQTHLLTPLCEQMKQSSRGDAMFGVA